MDEPDGTTGSALHYPTIVPRDTAALKSALLYWDRVRRIVPRDLVADGGRSHDDPVELEPFVAANVLRPADPEPFRMAAAQRFREIRPALNQQLDQSLRGAAEMSAIHHSKLTRRLVEELVEEGHAVDGIRGGWIEVRREVAGFYMHCLASVMSTGLAASLTTDDVDTARIGHWLAFGDPSERQGDQVRSYFMNIAMSLPSVAQLAAVPTERFLEFHQKYGPERRNFRKRIEAIVDATSKLKTAEAVEDVLATERSQLEEAAKDYRGSWLSLGLGAMYDSSGVITYPTGVVAVAQGLEAIGLLGTLVTGVLTGMGVAGLFAGLARVAVVTKGALVEARRANPYHYLTCVPKVARSHRR